MLLAVLFLAFQRRRHLVRTDRRRGGSSILLLLTLAKIRKPEESRRQRRWPGVGGAGLVASTCGGCWACRASATIRAPAGSSSTASRGTTNATGVVSAVNFENWGLDTWERVHSLHRRRPDEHRPAPPCGERKRPAIDQAADRDVPATSTAVRMLALLFTGPVVGGLVAGLHAKTSPSGVFQGGVVSPPRSSSSTCPGSPHLQAVQSRRPDRRRGGRGSGRIRRHRVSAVAMGLPYLRISCRSEPRPGRWLVRDHRAHQLFVGLEVAAAFVLIVGELLDQTLLIRQRGS